MGKRARQRARARRLSVPDEPRVVFAADYGYARTAAWAFRCMWPAEAGGWDHVMFHRAQYMAHADDVWIDAGRDNGDWSRAVADRGRRARAAGHRRPAARGRRRRLGRLRRRRDHGQFG